MSRSMVFALALLGLGVVVAQGVPQGGTVLQPDKQQTTFASQLTKDDPKVRINIANGQTLDLAAKLFEVKLSANRMYVFSLSSKTYDTAVVIRDATGKQLAFDDGEAGKFPDAMLFYTPPKDGQYKMVSAGFGLGNYNCVIYSMEFKSEVYNPAVGLRIAGKLDPMAKGVAYRVKLTAGKSYVIDLTSPNWDKLDPYLYLFNAAGKKMAENDDSGGGRNSQINFDAPFTGEYRLLVSSFGWKGDGPFTLTVRESAPVVPEALEGGRFEAKRQLPLTAPKDRLLKSSPHQMYAFNLAAGRKYMIDLKSADFDAFLRLEDRFGKQVAFDDDSGGGSDARIVFEPTESGVYRVYVTSLDKKGGTFTLKVQEK